MLKLSELQRSFQHYIEGNNEDIVEHIVNTKDANSEHRLAAYYNAYRARLIESLVFDFPATQAFIGEDKFEYLVINYLKKYPSEYPSVRWVGKHLAQFITEQEPFKNQEFIAELINFEWQQTLVFDGPNEDHIFRLENMTFSPEQWPELYFNFIPNLNSVDFFYNVNSYWKAVEEQHECPDILKNDDPVSWLFWRKGLDPNWRSLEVHEAWVLAQAKQGLSFGELCEGLTEWVDPEHVAITAAGFLKQWINDEILISVYLK